MRQLLKGVLFQPALVLTSPFALPSSLPIAPVLDHPEGPQHPTALLPSTQQGQAGGAPAAPAGLGSAPALPGQRGSQLLPCHVSCISDPASLEIGSCLGAAFHF